LILFFLTDTINILSGKKIFAKRKMLLGAVIIALINSSTGCENKKTGPQKTCYDTVRTTEYNTFSSDTAIIDTLLEKGIQTVLKKQVKTK